MNRRYNKHGQLFSPNRLAQNGQIYTPDQSSLPAPAHSYTTGLPNGLLPSPSSLSQSMPSQPEFESSSAARLRLFGQIQSCRAYISNRMADQDEHHTSYDPAASTNYGISDGHSTLPVRLQPPPMSTPPTSNPRWPTATSDRPRPAYTAAAPATLNLPRIQPSATTGVAIKRESPKERRPLQTIASGPAPPEPPAPPGSRAKVQNPPQSPRRVVGSQGRRGILPSATGYLPATPSMRNGSKLGPTYEKNSDGKYPCPNCNKVYLHAKHLKRHEHRHTGVRGYTCEMCNDNFARSDILKRHFEKCAARRGNPKQRKHLDYTRDMKKAKQQNQVDNMTAKTAQQHQMTSYTHLERPMGMVGLGQQSFQTQEPVMTHAGQTNGFNHASEMSTPSHRGSTASFTVMENNQNGQETPPSLDTSGAPTPLWLSDVQSNLNSPASTSFDHALNGRFPGSRDSIGSIYANGNLPQIAGQILGRSNELEFSHGNFVAPEDYSNALYSGTTTPHHYKNDSPYDDDVGWSYSREA